MQLVDKKFIIRGLRKEKESLVIAKTAFSLLSRPNHHFNLKTQNEFSF